MQREGDVVDDQSSALQQRTNNAPGAAQADRAPQRRMRSLNLSLVLISATALGGLAGCGNLESNARNSSRDVYANMEACKADWGTPGDCEEVPASRSHSGTTSYYGPRYYSRSGSTGYTSTARPGSRASGTISSGVSRGGFGASASRHSSSSSFSSSGG